MTPVAATQLRRALHDMAASIQHLQLAAHLTVAGHYDLGALEAAITEASQRFDRAIDMAHIALSGRSQVFPLAVVTAEEVSEVT